MSENQSQIIQLSDECVRLCEALLERFDRERDAMVRFDTEALNVNNLEKEALLGELVKRKQQLRDTLRMNFGEAEPETVLPEPIKSQWRERRATWLRTWEKLRRQVLYNQDFIRHSLKNLDLLSDNLKRLIGMHSVYSARGTRVDSTQQGSVVQGRY